MREVLDAVPARPRRILDPSCGDGAFLAECARRWPGAAVVGIEQDPGTAALARARVPGAVVHTADALAFALSPDFDLVAGNPPYAAARLETGDRDRIRREHGTARGSFDLAVPFVERAVRWLAPGGWLAMVVTNKLLVKDYAAPLRRWLAAETAIREVWDLAAGPAFPGVAVDAAVILAQRGGAAAPVRVRLASKTGGRVAYETLRLEGERRSRWEVHVTPEVRAILDRLRSGAVPLGAWPGVKLRDGILGRAYHTAPLLDGGDGLPVVGVGRIDAGRIAWDKPLRRAGQVFVDPRMQVAGAFEAFCRSPKVLVRGVSRRLVAAYSPGPAVPMVAVRAVTGIAEAERLVRWLNDPLATFVLHSECRGDRIPNGSFNISKAWLADLPMPEQDFALSPGEREAIAAWERAFGI